MKAYIIRRLIISVFILLGVSIILYVLIRLMPSDFVDSLTTGNQKVTPEMIARLKHLYGLDTSVLEGYMKWIGNVCQGNLGTSFIYQRPVTEVIRSKMWNSFALAATAMVLEYAIALPLGIISATHQYSRTDNTITVFALIGISLPSFFFAAILQRIFAIGLRWVPISGMVNARMDYQGFALTLDKMHHMILPVAVLTVISMGSLMRYTRTNMLEVVNADYIRTARAKGLSEKTVVYKHAFRNTLIPLVTLLGNSLPTLFSGAILTESIFGIDGLGNTAYNCILRGDIPFVMGFNMFIAVLTLLGTLFADILYAVVDPRVRLS